MRQVHSQQKATQRTPLPGAAGCRFPARVSGLRALAVNQYCVSAKARDLEIGGLNHEQGLCTTASQQTEQERILGSLGLLLDSIFMGSVVKHFREIPESRPFNRFRRRPDGGPAPRFGLRCPDRKTQQNCPRQRFRDGERYERHTP
jgi:hypothetical protein